MKSDEPGHETVKHGSVRSEWLNSAVIVGHEHRCSIGEHGNHLVEWCLRHNHGDSSVSNPVLIVHVDHAILLVRRLP